MKTAFLFDLDRTFDQHGLVLFLRYSSRKLEPLSDFASPAKARALVTAGNGSSKTISFLLRPAAYEATALRPDRLLSRAELRKAAFLINWAIAPASRGISFFVFRACQHVKEVV